MPGQRCSICSAPREIRERVNDALAKKVKLRTLAAESGFSRAGLSRHNRKCLPKQQLKNFRDTRKGARSGGRILIRWGEGGVFCYNRAAEIAAVPNDNDILIQVTFAKSLVQNPPALAKPADGKFPQKTQGKPQDATKSLAVSDSPLDAEHTNVPLIPPQHSPTGESCQHEMHRVSGDIERCVHCGFQSEPWKPTGVTRAFLEEKRNRFAPWQR
jgi:hypothetical protein